MLAPLSASSGDNPVTNTAPKNFRQLVLQYAGPELDEPDPTNVTEVLIAWFAPSNSTHELGGGMWTAANLALEEANRSGGFQGRPFRLVPHWSENPWTGGVGPLARMVYEQPIQAILGSLDGNGTHLAEQVVAKARLTLLSPVCTDKSVNLAGVPWMFSCAPHDGQIAPVLVDAVLASLDKNRADKLAVHKLRGTNESIVLFSVTDHDSRAALKEILKTFKKRNRSPDFQFECNPGITGIGLQLEAIKKASPAAIVVIGDALDSARLLRALRAASPGSELFGTHILGQTAFFRQAGAAAEGVRFPLLYFPQTTNAAHRAFNEAFLARQGEAPDYLAAFSFDATGLLIDALRHSGLNRARLRNTLAQTQWQGVAGPICWDRTGQNMRPVIRLGTIRQGRVVLESP